jgi:hypothetical protein
MCLLTDLRISNLTIHPLSFSEPEVFQSRRVPVIFFMFIRLDGFPLNFVLGTSVEICSENPDVVKMGQKYQALHMNTQELFIVACDI